METNKTLKLSFASLNPFIETHIVSAEERKVIGKEYILWGEGNKYPSYLKDLYNSVTTLASVINGSRDFCGGNDVTIVKPLYEGEYMNSHKQTIADIVNRMAFNYYMFGGWALQIIRNNGGEIAEIYCLDLNTLRTDKDNEVFWYSEEWDKKAGNIKAIRYPKFVPYFTDDNSILYYKGNSTGAYPVPVYAPAVKACEIERSIDEFHLNEINNCFMGSYLMNFNNGVPTDEVKEQIEKDVNEKFAGKSNAGRIMISFNDSKDNAVTLHKMEIVDFANKYDALAKHSRQQIFSAFRANANLFGIPTENNGFNSEEYESAFKLYSRVAVIPVQRAIADCFDKIYGEKGVLSIVPFTLDGATNNIN